MRYQKYCAHSYFHVLCYFQIINLHADNILLAKIIQKIELEISSLLFRVHN